MILVCPDWQRDLWWKDLQDMSIDKVFFPRAKRFSEHPAEALAEHNGAYGPTFSMEKNVKWKEPLC